ncbi:MAG TPA: hypothetical protein DCZ01_10705 [Elusimicrobia bacterium]|nr:MAG: hypothetical protein A2X37_11815 [Elusimicrobia bacterium GWA2_66_18]OGR71751.1 MAG: hypothetical protein A2X40_11180 [Elusimicrobia bacterium GWC2_65_9]HAZ08962.1 hypothetical protein [Elusimicrobiota bacterium]
MPEKTYTTHDIARFCDVYPSSVAKWINDGELRSYQTVGGHHRVTREDLAVFLQRLRIALPSELSSLMRVLIVDDDVEVARVLEGAFGRPPKLFQTEVCHDGIEALIRIGQQPPDLVILDVVLPKMDGVQVCRVLKTKPETRGIKVIAISGRNTPSTEKKLAEVKVDAFFRKPLDHDELLAKAAELLKLEQGVFARR